MRRLRFMEQQVIGILKEAEAGVKVAEHCRKHGILGAAYYNLKAKYRGLNFSELKRLTELEAQSAKLKRMHSRLPSENEIYGR